MSISNKLQGFLDQFQDLCSSFNINSSTKRAPLALVLDSIAIELGQSEESRKYIGSDDVGLWGDFSKLWRSLARAHLTFWDGDDDTSSSEVDDSDDKGKGKEDKSNGSTTASSSCSFSQFCVSLSRFTRNLVAAVPQNQTKAFENEADIRVLIHYYTSWTSVQDKDAVLSARVLIQALSNIITGNNALMSTLWETYFNLAEDQVVLIRLLSSGDDRTLVAVMTLIKNCIIDSRTRTKMLTRTTIGSRICVLLLDNMVKLYDADEGSDGGKAFDTGYEIFTRIFEAGLLPELYKKLTMEGEIVTPHQTTLLKILDSYLQSTQILSPPPSTKKKIHIKLAPMLATYFFSLSTYSQTAIRRALRPSEAELLSPTVSPISLSTPHSHSTFLPTELDVMLPKVCEALVLVIQCIVSIILDSQGAQLSPDSEVGPVDNLQDYFNGVNNPEGVGLVENLIALLRLLDRFLPRINFGKPVDTPQSSDLTTPRPNMDSSSQPQQAQQLTPPTSGFSYLKRDLVRLLGILCHECLAVQDRVRICGGLEVVMNLCVVDERNPYLREHAIFALHNLLKGNPANQAIVDEIKPLGQWDENGVLQDTPGAVRR
ncbi:hypothetical protein K435DRAFT_232145 [Dendrothele bispora CBS 962.96]|uniref:Ataxin-10 homolog n=1 Tax=Dendrothele bispora (strain CBS 962.96) TaxID=1314807 RepID=A0A4V4HEL3_DENBC|nr:hypothetical protein K435DRAFT_232145 [Dendrothele bispora CBS 962.96]